MLISLLGEDEERSVSHVPSAVGVDDDYGIPWSSRSRPGQF